MTGLTPGLYGKLPAHGDFVRRGWDDAATAGLDAWLTGGVAALRDGADDDAFAAKLVAAPLWHAWLPEGFVGPRAFHFALAPSVDRAGRHFFLAVGVAGDARGVWAAVRHPALAWGAEAALFDALGGTLDADGVHTAIALATPAVDDRDRFLAGLAIPPTALFWIADPAEGDPVVLGARTADTKLLAALVNGGPE